MRLKSSDVNWKGFFCAEVCAAMYQQMGILNETTETNNFMPCDFSSEAPGRYAVKLLNGAYLDDEEIIKAPLPEGVEPCKPLLTRASRYVN